MGGREASYTAALLLLTKCLPALGVYLPPAPTLPLQAALLSPSLTEAFEWGLAGFTAPPPPSPLRPAGRPALCRWQGFPVPEGCQCPQAPRCPSADTSGLIIWLKTHAKAQLHTADSLRLFHGNQFKDAHSKFTRSPLLSAPPDCMHIDLIRVSLRRLSSPVKPPGGPPHACPARLARR